MSLPIEHVASNGTTELTNGTFINNELTWTQTTAVTGNKIAVVAYLSVSSGTSLSAATASGTYGGQAMTATKIHYGVSAQNQALIAFRLLNAPSGSQTVSVSINGMTQNLANKQYAAGCAVYRNVDGLGLEGTFGSANSGTFTTQTMPFSNVLPRDVCVGIHGREDSTAFASYSLNTRFTNTEGGFTRGLVGDSIGLALSGTVNSTVTSGSSDNMAAIGIKLLRGPGSGFLQMF